MALRQVRKQVLLQKPKRLPKMAESVRPTVADRDREAEEGGDVNASHSAQQSLFVEGK